jgi:predicted metal-dependent hydrolase
MPEEKKILLEDLGEILIKRDKRIRRLSIRMAPGKGIWINAPFGISTKEAISFVQENKAWIRKNRNKIERKEARQTIFTPEVNFRTKYHHLIMEPVQSSHYSAQLSNGKLKISYPKHISVLNDDLQNFVKKSVLETLKREAQYYLPKRTMELAKLHGFTYKSVTIKNTRSRWGSCSYDNRINLSLHLMRLPGELIDMVVLHELCHTKIKNHSQEFWALLGKHCNDLTRKKTEIKNYSTNII